MAYTTNIPLSSQQISNTTSAIRGNFDALAWVGSGYAAFAEVATPAAATNQMKMYAQESSSSGSAQTEMFLRREGGTIIEFTGALANNNGWTRLPSGILLKWGEGQGTGSFTHTVSQGPAFSAVYSVQVCDWGNVTTDLDRTIRFRSFTLPQSLNLYASFRTTTGATLAAFQYLVIGS